LLLLLVGVAVAAAEVAARPDGVSSAGALATAVTLTALAGLAQWCVRSRAGNGQSPPRLGFFLLVAVLVLPYPLEPLRRLLTATPRPLELILIDSLRNLCLGLAVLAAWPVCLRLAAFASVFLVLFATAMGSDAGVLVLVGAYAGVGTVWLMLAYWADLRAAAGDSRPRPPWPAVLTVLLVVAGGLGLGALGPVRAARVLAELLPTSGGSSSYDAAARGGLGDGDDEVRGPNAQSVGFTESDVFLEDDRPSLYDAVSDVYGEPFKPKQQEHMIALGREKVVEQDRPPAENLGSSLQFETSRDSPGKTRPPDDRHADALFFVAGRTPVLLRMVAYDHFDGANWREGDLVERDCLLEKERESCWMRVNEANRAPVFAADDFHQIRVARLKGAQFPTPPHLARFRLGKVHRANFFAWTQEGILRLSKRKVPSAVTLETETRTVAPELLADIAMTEGGPHVRPRFLQLPTNPPVAAAALALARQWIEGKPYGWAQVEAVVAGLRGHAVHDRTVSAPEGCRDTVGHFLLHARRGPDYQFASAAAVLLRSLGYPTRVVSGFYASPEHYDARTGQTPVNNDDIHFWAEVCVPGNVWVAIEPTPGYTLPGPRLSWGQWLALLASEVGLWLTKYATALALGFLALAVLVWRRRDLIDGVAVLLWRWRAGPWRRCVLETLRLLERRSRWAGRPRPPGTSPAGWYGEWLGKSPLADLADLADWAAYAPAELPPPYSPAEARSLCAAALRTWTTRRMRNEVRT
jgi:transglutaminase-like putative cysteine protease